MGKYRPKKKTNKLNPIEGSKEKKSPNESHVLSDKRIENILKDLKSANTERRLFGLEAIAQITGGMFDDRCQILFDSGIVRLIGPFMLDEDRSIRRAAAGAIRNLTTFSKECVDRLVDQDIMTSVITLLKNMFSNEWTPIKVSKQSEESNLNGTRADDGAAMEEDKGSEEEEEDEEKESSKKVIKQRNKGLLLDEQTDTFVQIAHILWNICENNSEAVKIFNGAELIDILARCLNPDVYPPEVTLVVGQCLITISEDNPTAQRKLLSYQPLIERLLTRPGDSPEDVFLRVIVAALAYNLELSSCTLQALECIHKSLEIDHKRTLLKVTNCLAATEIDDSNKASLNLEKEIFHCLNLLDAQSLSLEILTNMCLPNEDDLSSSEEPMDGDWSSAEEEETFEDSLIEAASLDISAPSPENLKEFQQALSKANILNLIWERTKSIAENEKQCLEANPSSGHALLKKILDLRCHSFLCLNNLIQALDLEYLGGIQSLYNFCIDLTKLLLQKQESNEKILEAISTALIASLRRLIALKDKGSLECFKELSESDLLAFEQILLQISEPNVLANLIRSLSLYGQIALSIESPISLQLIKVCARILLKAANGQENIWLLSEALDSLMDFFSEDETDALAQEIGLIGQMKHLRSSFKHKMHLQKRQRAVHPHQDIISTVHTNLPRFIRYKEARVSKLAS